MKRSNKNSPIRKYRQAQDPKMSLEAFGGLFKPKVHKATVLRWERGFLTLERALDIEKRVGIPRQDLRPDVFKRESAA